MIEPTTGKGRYILGISAFYHDSAACILRDGDIVAAASEERFTRRKGDASFPRHAVDFCLKEAGVRIADLDHVGFYDKPLLKFERILESYLGVAPRGVRSFVQAGPVWIKEKLFMDHTLRSALGYDGRILYAEHHESHAASAFFPSPFEEAAILTADGVGEWATSSIGVGRGNDLEILKELHWPDSLGLLYSAFTYHLGFRVNSGEYKVMGLAPYGEPRYVGTILSELMELHDDGSFALNQRYFGYLTGLTMTSPAFDRLFGGSRRVPEGPLEQRHLDLARSVQHVCEELILRMAREAHRVTGLDTLCLAGGVALNCVANGRLLREGPFRKIWIQPAAGDAGGSLGVAQLLAYRHAGLDRKVSRVDGMRGTFLGSHFPDDEVRDRLDGLGASYLRLDRAELNRRVAEGLADGLVVGWHNGRSEFGPRALGARSILGDPRDPAMQSRMNLKIKFRESFRPFAPSILSTRAREYFDLDVPSPYMMLVAPVRQELRRADGETGGSRGLGSLAHPRSSIPAVTHVDYSARVQTVGPEDNPDFHDLLEAFSDRTGCPLLVNTSFNVRGEPIVDSPEDAYDCFMRTGMDWLVIGPFILEKGAQPPYAAGRATSKASSPLSSGEGRRFALTVGGGLLLVGAMLIWQDGFLWGAAIVAAALGLGTAGLTIPERLGPAYRAWMGLATLLSKVTTPLFMGIVYFLVLAPTALLVRAFGRNPLNHRQAGGGFWVRRAAEKTRSDLTHQF